MGQRKLRLDPVLGVIAVASAGIAHVTFGTGVTDFRYQVAGLADPFLGRPSPVVTFLLGGMVTTVATVILFVIPAARSQSIPWRWGWLIVAGWVAYMAGAITIASGPGSHTYAGAISLGFGAPLTSSAEVSATCRSVVGEPAHIASVEPSVGGLPRLDFHHVVTGRSFEWIGGDPTLATWPFANSSAFEPPGVPARVAIYQQYTDAAGTVTKQPPATFLRAYEFHVGEVKESGMSGSATLTGTRIPDRAPSGNPRWVNHTIPDDPWPPIFTFVTRWTCTEP